MNFSPSTWKNNVCYSAIKFHALVVFERHSDRLCRFSCTAITTRPWNRTLRTSDERYYFTVNLNFFCILLTIKRPKCLQNIIVSHSLQVSLCARSNNTACAKSSFAHVVWKNCVRYACEKVILFPCRLSPSLRSGANVPTRIKSLFRTCIENNYFNTPCAKLEFAHALIKEHALN